MGKQKNIDAKMLDIKEGRVRLYHNEFESIIAALASIKMMRSRLADLKRVAMLKDRKTWRKLKAGVELMESGIVEYTTKMSCKQEHSLQINSGNVYFTASPNQGCFNMP